MAVPVHRDAKQVEGYNRNGYANLPLAIFHVNAQTELVFSGSTTYSILIELLNSVKRISCPMQVEPAANARVCVNILIPEPVQDEFVSDWPIRRGPNGKPAQKNEYRRQGSGWIEWKLLVYRKFGKRTGPDAASLRVK
jgi:hypothetical protein